MKENEIIDIMITMFLGYKYRKEHDLLYSHDGRVPISLIKMYYSGDYKRLDSKSITKSFVDKYIKNESEIENVHEKSEIEGLGVMYDDMTKTSFDEFELFSLIVLHKDLYSKCPYPEAGGKLRNRDVYLPGSGCDLSNYSYVFDDLCKYEDIVKELKIFAQIMRENNDYKSILEYIDKCVKLGCNLINVHPFDDGNGRTIRCFINKLFIEAGIPPVYIKKNEKQEYNNAMNKANNEKDYKDITNFYLYKICDSIIELDINKRVLKEREEKIYDVKKKKSKKR